MNFLLVEPDQALGTRLTEALAARGCFLRHTVDEFYALTMAERAEISRIFVSAKIAGLPVQEFLNILVSDPSLSDVQLAVYDLDQGVAELPGDPRFDRLAARSEGELVAAIIRRVEGQSEDPPESHTSEIASEVKRRGLAMVGVFEMTSLPGLLQMVCATEESGTIMIRTPAGVGQIGFAPGVVTFVEYGGRDGVVAMANLMEDVEEHPHSPFRVGRAVEAEGVMTRITPTELLLEVAVLRDDRQRAILASKGNQA